MNHPVITPSTIFDTKRPMEGAVIWAEKDGVMTACIHTATRDFMVHCTNLFEEWKCDVRKTVYVGTPGCPVVKKTPFVVGRLVNE